VSVIVIYNIYLTGAGKTYTMLGTDDDPGIMVRGLNDLFVEMDRTRDEMKYKVSMSYLEVYIQCSTVYVLFRGTYTILFHISSKFDFFISVEMVMCHALICIKGIYQSLTW